MSDDSKLLVEIAKVIEGKATNGALRDAGIILDMARRHYAEKPRPAMTDGALVEKVVSEAVLSNDSDPVGLEMKVCSLMQDPDWECCEEFQTDYDLTPHGEPINPRQGACCCNPDPVDISTEERVRRIIAAVRAHDAEAGMVVVPREPSDDLLHAMGDAYGASLREAERRGIVGEYSVSHMRAAYAAMLAATPPRTEVDDGKAIEKMPHLNSKLSTQKS